MQASFVSENFRPRRIDINKAGENELAAHPYLSKFAAQPRLWLIDFSMENSQLSKILLRYRSLTQDHSENRTIFGVPTIPSPGTGPGHGTINDSIELLIAYSAGGCPHNTTHAREHEAYSSNLLHAGLRNLSGNSRSLLLIAAACRAADGPSHLSFLAGDRSFEIIRSLMSGRGRKIAQVLDSRMEANNEASKKLRSCSASTSSYMKSVARATCVGWPLLCTVSFPTAPACACPLLYFPVSIVQQGAHWVLEPRADAGITFNKSFLLAYAYYNKVTLDEA